MRVNKQIGLVEVENDDKCTMWIHFNGTKHSFGWNKMLASSRYIWASNNDINGLFSTPGSQDGMWLNVLKVEIVHNTTQTEEHPETRGRGRK